MVFICMLFFSSCLSLVSDIATRVWDNWYSTADLQLRSSVFLFCSYVSAPPFFFTFLGRIQDLFSYLFLDLFFLYFFPELKTKRFTFCQAAPWGSTRSFSVLNGLYPSQGWWRGLHSGSTLLAKMHGFMGHQALWQGTQETNLLTLGLFFSYLSRQKNEFVSCLEFQKQHTPLSTFPSQACLWRLPAVASLDKHKAYAWARYSVMSS